MKINGQKLIVPCNTILQLPATALTWADLFDVNAANPIGTLVSLTAAPPQQGVGQTRLALADNPMPFPSFEVRAQGNVVNGQYIVGLIVPITQQGLNVGAGVINAIDYSTGTFRVGGTIGDPNCATIASPLCSGSLVQINDPAGRFGLVHSPDQRFTADTNNPTVHHATGFPACIPRVAPPGIDAECPLANRPPNGSVFGTDPFLAVGDPLKKFTMPAPGATCTVPSGCPDPTRQAPLMIGDWVNYSGTLFKIDPLKTIATPGGAIPDNTAANSYISIHTLDSNVAIFTQPGMPPAYMSVEDLLIGTNGAAVAGILQEASTRLTVVGFTTDPTRLVDIYAVDVNPCSGVESLRLLATTDPLTQPLVGRFVHRVLGGLFMPPTREYMVKSRTQLLDPLTGLPTPQLVANGLLAGQYRLPNFEYIFPENHAIGDPVVPDNFQDLPFLALGSGPILGAPVCTATGCVPGPSVVVSQLNPWPGAAPYNGAPTPPTCAGGGASPIVTVTPTLSAATNSQVLLTGVVAWDLNSVAGSRTAVWSQVPTPGAPTVALSATTLTGNTATASFIAPATATALTFVLTATDNLGTGSATVNVTVLAGGDIVQFVPGTVTWVIQRGQRGGFGKLNATAVSSDATAVLSLTEIGVDSSFTDWGTGTKSPSAPGVSNWVELKGAPQPLTLTVTSTKGGSATVSCSAPDAKGRVTCP